MTTSGTLLGSIIATIISVQPKVNATATTATEVLAPPAASWCRKCPYGEPSHNHNASQASPAMRHEGPGQDRPIPTGGAQVRGREHRPGSVAASGREAEVALEGVVPLEVHARDAVTAPVLRELARLACEHR